MKIFEKLFKKYDPRGFDKEGIHKNGTLYDDCGYDAKGFKEDGYSYFGFDKDGYDKDGFDGYGYNKYGYDRYGFNRNGYDKNGYDKDGFNTGNLDRDGRDRYGFNFNGYDKNGFCRNGEAKMYTKDGNLNPDNLMLIKPDIKLTEIKENMSKNLRRNLKSNTDSYNTWGYYDQTSDYTGYVRRDGKQVKLKASTVRHIQTRRDKGYCIKRSVYCAEYRINYEKFKNEYMSLFNLPCRKCYNNSLDYNCSSTSLDSGNVGPTCFW